MIKKPINPINGPLESWKYGVKNEIGGYNYYFIHYKPDLYPMDCIRTNIPSPNVAFIKKVWTICLN